MVLTHFKLFHDVPAFPSIYTCQHNQKAYVMAELCEQIRANKQIITVTVP